MSAKDCAREICDFIAEHPVSSEFDISAIIQRLLSSEVAKVHGEYQKLAQKWRGDVNAYTAANDPWAAGACDICAFEVEALAPNKEGRTHE